MVHPVAECRVSKLSHWNAFEVNVLDEVIAHGSLFFLLLFLVELVEAQRRDVGSSTDTCNLCAQVVGLVSGEGWESDNGGVKATGQEFLHAAGAGDLCGCNTGQFDPWLSG